MTDPPAVAGLEVLGSGGEPVMVAIGVFDGLHRGHAHLVRRLVREAWLNKARPVVITFDHHPDAVIQGTAPPLLLDPDERLARLRGLGVQTVAVVHFDDRLRHTPYDAFVAAIAAQSPIAGFVMTRESAFGHQRRGTPAALVELGRGAGFRVIVSQTISLDGTPVTSSAIRTAIQGGDLAAARRLLGRPFAVTGHVADDRLEVSFRLPVALPPEGRYRARVGAPIVDPGVPWSARPRLVSIGPEGLALATPVESDGRRRIAFAGRDDQAHLPRR